VAAAVFTANNGKLTLQDLDTRDLRYDVTKDEAWLPALAEGLRDLSRSNSKFRGKATFILPGYQLLIKPIKVPHVEAAKQSQIVAFEAQNNIPFPLSEAVWGSQVVADDGVETEVVLAAQKAEVANRFCGLMSTIGFQPISLQPGSLLDYNAYKFVYGGEQEDTLVVNIGARSTNLTFISPAGLFIRNVTLGGNSFTQMVADVVGKSFAEAEDVKLAFYSGQTSFDADHPAVAPLQLKAQDFMKRLSQQITQSIIAYRRASNRAAPQRVLLTGRGALLAGIPEFLSESQKVSVDYFNPSGALSLGAAVDKSVIEQYYYQVSEMVGEASRLVKPDAMGINLLPPLIRERLAFQKQKPFLALAGVCLALAPLPMLYKYQQEAAVVKYQKDAVDGRTSQLKSLSNDIRQASDDATATRAKIAQYQGLMTSRFNWIIFFSDLQNILVGVKDVWLDNLAVQRQAAHAPATNGMMSTPAAAPAPGAPTDPNAAPVASTTTYKLNIKGRLLLRDTSSDSPASAKSFQQAEASKRIHDIEDGFAKIPFVKQVDQSSEKFDFITDPRMVGFEFTVDIDPNKPL